MGILDRIIDLRVASQLFLQEANARSKDIKLAERSATVCMRKNDMEEATIHAEDAVRLKNERTEFKRLAARINATASQLETAQRMHKVTRTMEGTVHLMVDAGRKLDVAKVTRIMDRFDKESKDMRTKQNTVSTSMHCASASLTPEKEVGLTLQKLADQANLDLEEKFGAIFIPKKEEEEEEIPESVESATKRVAVPLGGGGKPKPVKKRVTALKKKKEEEEEPSPRPQKKRPIPPCKKKVASPPPHPFIIAALGEENGDDDEEDTTDFTPVLEPEQLPRGPLIDFGNATSVHITPIMPPPPLQPVECRPMDPVFHVPEPEPEPPCKGLLDLSPPELSLEDRVAKVLGRVLQ